MLINQWLVGQQTESRSFPYVLPIAMKLRFSCTLRQDTSVGLLPGIAGKILVQRGFPLSLLSRFQTFTFKRSNGWVSCWSMKISDTIIRLLWRTTHLPEGLFHVHPGPLIQGCCAASAGRGVLLAACRPERMSIVGSASKARSCHPYVTFWRSRTVTYSRS